MGKSGSSNLSWVADDLARVEAVANELEAYIVAGEVYRTVVVPISEGNRKMTVSGGDLLARLKRLQEQRSRLTPEQQARLDRADAKAKSTIYSLRTRFHDLLRRELKSRNDQLAWDMELRKEREEKEADHAELKNRQVIAIIRDELNAPAPTQP
ncbi:MAG: hypothetical protein DYG89_44610 [Caldilinea sp. CFX5]|nr:hypothetical protein [Caldilinea sp. CFX5]